MIRVTYLDIEPPASEYCRSCGDGKAGGLMDKQNLIIGDPNLGETICRYCAEMVSRATYRHEERTEEWDD